MNLHQSGISIAFPGYRREAHHDHLPTCHRGRLEQFLSRTRLLKMPRRSLLLHGFPTSSHMFRNLIPLLADHFHVVAPDLPGFGFSDAPDREHVRYTFENLANVVDRFTQTLALERYAVYLRLRERPWDSG